MREHERIRHILYQRIFGTLQDCIVQVLLLLI